MSNAASPDVQHYSLLATYYGSDRMPIRTIRGQSVVITGATSGIGRETALAFARGGARVVVAGRRQERLDELVAEVEGRGGEALAVQTDVAEQSQVEQLIERTVERFG